MLLPFVPASFIEANAYKNIKNDIIKNSHVSVTAISTFAENERLNYHTTSSGGPVSVM